jgi:hypothetical protein
LLCFSSAICNTNPYFLTRNMAQNAVLLGNLISWVYILACVSSCMLPHWLSKIFIPNFVYHHFWPKLLLQNLMYLLWFMIIYLISCDASQNSEFVFWGQWATLIGPLPKKKNWNFVNPKHWPFFAWIFCLKKQFTHLY